MKGMYGDMELKGKKINFLGDSITEGHGTKCSEEIFMNVMAREEGLAEARNYGIGGTRIARQRGTNPEKVVAVWDQDFCSRVEQMDPDADAVVVFGGTNDFGHGDAPLGHFADRTPDTFYGAMHTLCISLIEKYPDAVIVFMTPLHRLTEYTRTCNEFGVRNDSTLEDYVNIISEVCAYYGIPVLDLFRNSGMQPEVPALKQKYMPDGLHPNGNGHMLIARKLAAFLKLQ